MKASIVALLFLPALAFAQTPAEQAAALIEQARALCEQVRGTESPCIIVEGECTNPLEPHRAELEAARDAINRVLAE